VYLFIIFIEAMLIVAEVCVSRLWKLGHGHQCEM